MKILDDIAVAFSSDFSCVDRSENNFEVKVRFKISQPHRPNDSVLKDVLSAFPIRDFVTVSCVLGDFDSCSISGIDIDDVSFFINDLDAKLAMLDHDDESFLEIHVKKADSEGRVSVYFLEDLVSFWGALGPVDSFKRIQSLSSRASVLEVFNLSESCFTSLFSFVSFGSDAAQPKRITLREEVHEKRDRASHFANSSSFNFVPEDFDFSGRLPKEEKLLELFSSLKLLASVIYLCDFSKFDEAGGVHLRLNGYRLFSRDLVPSDRLDISFSDEYFNIYRWVYGDGDVIDKVGLARNIITLHLCEEDLFRVQKGTLQSICSGYQIYLKDNVKQYIEIKNKLSEFIQDSSDKASDMAKNLGSYYKNSIWTLYSFFISVLLIRILSKNEGALITDSVFGLFLVFIAVTLVVMRYALREMEEDKGRFVFSYESFKGRYKDLLLPEDLDRILDGDKQFEEDLTYIDRKVSDFRFLWGLSLSIMFSAVAILWMIG